MHIHLCKLYREIRPLVLHKKGKYSSVFLVTRNLVTRSEFLLNFIKFREFFYTIALSRIQYSQQLTENRRKIGLDLLAARRDNWFSFNDRTITVCLFTLFIYVPSKKIH